MDFRMSVPTPSARAHQLMERLLANVKIVLGTRWRGDKAIAYNAHVKTRDLTLPGKIFPDVSGNTFLK